jgi:hypothetical protein
MNVEDGSTPIAKLRLIMSKGIRGRSQDLCGVLDLLGQIRMAGPVLSASRHGVVVGR